MTKLIVPIFILAASLNAEQSVFGAGDLESSAPYGLTSAEKVIVKNKKIVKKNEKKINKFDSKLNDIDQRVSGIESILEGESVKLDKISKSFNKHIAQLAVVSEKSTAQTKELDEIKLQLEENTQNIRTIKESLDKIVNTVNDINSDYVTKAEFNKLISMLDKKDRVKAKKSKKSNKELMDEARKLFKKDYFTKALPILHKLIKENHRPAECNYYVGEIKFYRKKYKDALHYYKTSMMLYDKAKYLPRLLLHSAISFEKLGDEQNAQNFYNTLVDIYPESSEAKKASKKIKL